MGFRNPAVWMILILLIVLLFGASKLPDITRNIGKSLKIFKEEVQDLQGDGKNPPVERGSTPPPQQNTPSHQDSEQPPQPPHAGGTPPQAPNPPTDPQ